MLSTQNLGKANFGERICVTVSAVSSGDEVRVNAGVSERTYLSRRFNKYKSSVNVKVIVSDSSSSGAPRCAPYGDLL